MKSIRFFLLFIFITAGIAASSQDYFLLPENFFLHKHDKLTVHLFVGDKFEKFDERSYYAAKTIKFALYEGKIKTNLLPVTRDSVSPVLDYQMNTPGLALLEMTRDYSVLETGRAGFLKYLDDEGFTAAAAIVNAGTQKKFKEKYTTWLKTLVTTGKPTGNIFNRVLGDEFEIVLQDNPYTLNYGDDISALINFRGKPVKNVPVEFYYKNAAGKVSAERSNTDDHGLATFKVTKEGIYLIRAVHMEPSALKDADFEGWKATYTFAFSSANNLPDTYRNFGFGNKH